MASPTFPCAATASISRRYPLSRRGERSIRRRAHRSAPASSTGGTGHRIVSARSSPSSSGLRSAAHWDARKRQSSQSVREEERRACAPYFRWTPFPTGQAPVRGRFACAPRLRAREGRRSAPRAGNARSRKRALAVLARHHPTSVAGVAPDPNNTSLAQVRAADPAGAAAPCPCPREVGVGAAAPTSGIPLSAAFGRRLLMPTRAANARPRPGRGRDHMRGDADTSESVTAKSGTEKTRTCDTPAAVSAVPCGRVAVVGWLLRPSPRRDAHAEVPHRGLLYP